MQDDVMDQIDRGYLELARRLEAYADLRLTPSLSASTAMRTSVMQAARRRAALLQADPTLVASATAAVATERSQPTRARARWRRPVGALLAAGLTVGIVAGSVSAASPGGPLYATRLWVEMVGLPSDPMARAEAELARLQDRLREAQQALNAGDGPAAAAALAAYSAILAEADQGSSGDAAANAVIEGGVTRHVAVLTLLLDKVPATARDAIEHALASSTKVLDDLHGTNDNDSGGSNGTTPGQPGGAAPGQPGGAGAAGDPGQPPKPTSTAKPASTDQPERPVATARPVKPDPARPGKPEKTIEPAKPTHAQGQSPRD